MKHIFLDVETKRTFDEVGGYFPEKLGISFVGIVIREGMVGVGEPRGFFEKDLPALFPILETADVVVGFNIDGFDMPAMVNYYSGDLSQIPTLDLMGRIKDSVGHRIGLDAVAKETLGIGKTGDGLDAIKYYQTGQLDKLRDYCLQDVAMTRDLYDYGLNKGQVKFRNKWNRLIECSVDFTFTPDKGNGVQMSLI
ncbi:ribonuclease H-like domain-containing protein [Patescibacteria group bacterium]|nr:ribonuclease H-like domain-containing protein [Patescibacteria group bacterium]MBU1967374.1 ribonuclease H-like domain-containing protein [Patescibacteria group bacterium]MBU2543149.1 ribonuclease H-like domain-containing protein [Patescibacteria group bacterium]